LATIGIWIAYKQLKTSYYVNRQRRGSQRMESTENIELQNRTSKEE
jgi:hypothetical protein